MRAWFYTRLFLWSGSKMWQYVHIYHPDSDDEPPRAMTWSNDEDYIDKIGEVEVPNHERKEPYEQD